MSGHSHEIRLTVNGEEFCESVEARQTLVEWAGQTIVFCPWAKAYYERQRAKGSAHHAILRALAFKWLRVLWRCWQKRQPYNEEQFLRQLEKRRSPIAARARQLALEMAA